MPKADYTKSELWTLDELDRLAWIEIAKRKERKENSGAYADLVRLRHELATFFDSWSTNTKINLPYDNGTDDFFDVMQFGFAIEEVVTDSEQADLLHQSLERFGERAKNTSDSLSYYKGFRLADFSVETNLEALHGWWSWISSGKGRMDLGAIGRFSSHGEPKLVPAVADLWFAGEDHPTICSGELVKTTSAFTNPVRIPRRVQSRQMWNFSTDDHDIVIDGVALKNRLVLSFDLLTPLPSMRNIELILLSAHGLAMAERNMAMLEKGIVPEDLLTKCNMNEDGDYTRLMLEPLEEHKLVTGQQSVCPLIFGLYCWDLVRDGLKDAEASRHAHNKFVNATGQPYYTERKALYGLNRLVRPKVDTYHPEQLQWNN